MTFLNGCLYWPEADNNKTMQRVRCLHRRARVPCTACTTSSAHSSAHMKNIPLCCQNMFDPATKTLTHKRTWPVDSMMVDAPFLKGNIFKFVLLKYIFVHSRVTDCIPPSIVSICDTLQCLSQNHFKQAPRNETQTSTCLCSTLRFAFKGVSFSNQFTSDVLEICCQFI